MNSLLVLLYHFPPCPFPLNFLLKIFIFQINSLIFLFYTSLQKIVMFVVSILHYLLGFEVAVYEPNLSVFCFFAILSFSIAFRRHSCRLFGILREWCTFHCCILHVYLTIIYMQIIYMLLNSRV